MQLVFDPWFYLTTVPDTRQRRYVLGLIFIFLVSIIWTASSVCAQYLYSELEFESPFLMTYIGVCLFSLILPAKYCTDYFGITQDNCSESLYYSSDHEIHSQVQGGMDRRNPNELVTVRTFDSLLRHKGDKWNHGKHFFAALHIAPVMFIANWLFNAALTSTSVASATVLVSTSCVFVFILAVLAKEEKFQMFKLTGVLLAVAGTVLTGWHDLVHHDIDDDPDAACATGCEYVMWGDTLAIIAAVAHGAYAIQVRLLCPQEEERYSMVLLLGYIGLILLVLLFPVAVFVFTQVQNFTWTVLGWVVARGILEFLLSEYLHFRAVILTNATLATVGLGMTIPFAFLADIALGKANVFSIGSCLGALSVASGFLLVNFAYGDDDIDHSATNQEPEYHPSESGDPKNNRLV